MFIIRNRSTQINNGKGQIEIGNRISLKISQGLSTLVYKHPRQNEQMTFWMSLLRGNHQSIHAKAEHFSTLRLCWNENCHLRRDAISFWQLGTEALYHLKLSRNPPNYTVSHADDSSLHSKCHASHFLYLPDKTERVTVEEQDKGAAKNRRGRFYLQEFVTTAHLKLTSRPCLLATS